MTAKRQRPPRSTSSLIIGRAVKRLKTMPMADRIQLLVKAGLMTREEADKAKQRLATNGAAE